jgi:putative flippase GtrA
VSTMRTSSARVSVGMVARYVLIGGLTFGIYFVLLRFLFGALGAAYPFAVAVAYASAVAFHFVANRQFTFQVGSRSFGVQAAKYAVVLLISYCSQLAAIYLLYELVKLNFYVAALAGIGVTLPVGFFLLRFWVFTPARVASQFGHRA